MIQVEIELFINCRDESLLSIQDLGRPMKRRFELALKNDQAALEARDVEKARSRKKHLYMWKVESHRREQGGL